MTKASWQRITVTLALLLVIAFGQALKLQESTLIALLPMLGMAIQFLFHQKGEESRKPQPPIEGEPKE